MQTSSASEGEPALAVNRKMSSTFVIGLGSNLGERSQHLTRAVSELARFSQLDALSRVYATPPLGPPQPDYLNAAVRIRVELSPERLLDQTLAIEQAAGRVRDVRWGPRTLDLDILWADVPYVSARLRVPHSELRSRTFALAPLLDVAPELASDYARALQDLGGSPRVCGILSWDRTTQVCGYSEVDTL
jgi:2-amino-4-hydroxy-6-hydroxymethyldihydropteridine diphosphokinase